MVFLIGLGLIDVIAAITMLLFHFDITGWRIAAPAGIYLVGKGVAFPKDFASIVDFIVGLYILGMAALGFKSIFVYVCAAWLLQKGILSVASR